MCMYIRVALHLLFTVPFIILLNTQDTEQEGLATVKDLPGRNM